MSDRIDERKIILVAFPTNEACQDVEDKISTRFEAVTFFRAGDGFETWSKMLNVPPHVVILPANLPKLDALRMVNNILKDRRFDQTALVLISQPPEQQMFVDEILAGRLHFIADTSAEKLSRALTRSFNHVSSAQQTDFKLVFLSAGDPLLSEGDNAEFVYLVRSGRLQAFHRREETVALGMIETGEFVGEMAYINGEPRSASVKAVSDCELIEIPISHLDQFLYRKPAWSKALMATLSKRLKKANSLKT